MWDLLLYAAIGFGIYKLCKFMKSGAEDFSTAVSMGGGERDGREKGIEEQVNESAAVHSMNRK